MVLDGGQVKAQGAWQIIQHKVSSSISKFSLHHDNDRGGDNPSSTPGKADIQVRVKQDAQADLTRKTGDLGLYRQCHDDPGHQWS